MPIDAHVHFDRYTENLPEALQQIAAHRILTIGVGMDIPSYLRTKEIAATSPWLVATFGIHPWNAHHYAENLSALDPYLQETPLIGEAGLDFLWVEDRSHDPAQRAVFRYQCQWAQRLSKPMNLHTKDAEAEIIQTLNEFNLRGSIIHWYSGPFELIDDYLALGCYFTLGVETLTSPAIVEIAKKIPLQNILLETDNPGGWEWLSGQVGMPSVLLAVHEKVAEIKGISSAQLESQLTENWQAFSASIKHLSELGRGNNPNFHGDVSKSF
jgi:TatD DNase family protein